MKKISQNNQSGQVLVIIFILMIISLSIGITVSSKYIKGLRNITQSDQSSKAIAIAESALEHLLLLPVETLEDYAVNNSCGTNCHHEITEATGQIVSADVEISILGNSNEPYILDLVQDQTMQVNLTGYPQNQTITACWNGSIMSVTAMYIHGTTGSYEADSFSYNPLGSLHSENGFETASPALGFENCFIFSSLEDSQMLRLKSIYTDGSVIIFPASGASLPTQGILMESRGVAGTANKYVSIIITDPVLPSHFDYAIYQKSTTEPLSN